MGGHAFLAPSGAGQWGPGRCHGSASLQARFPEPEGEEAKEGTVCHDYAASAVLGQPLALGWVHPNGYALVQEMVENASAYVDGCRTIMHEVQQEPGATFYVEQRVFGHKTISEYNDGTPDFFAVFPVSRRVVVLDFKYGHGYVSAFRNFQLLNYLLMIFETLGLGVPDDTWTIEATIYQPRSYHSDGPVRTWRPKGSELAFWIGEFVVAARFALATDAETLTGPWCRYCTAAHACQTLQEDASFARGHAGRALVENPNLEAKGRELKAINRAMGVLKARKEALEHNIEENIFTHKQRVPGWTGDYKHSPPKWNVPIPRVKAYCKVLGVDVEKEAVITPTQAAKLGLDLAMVQGITTTTTSYVLTEVTAETLAKGLTENG